jgi:hypothetical protein
MSKSTEIQLVAEEARSPSEFSQVAASQALELLSITEQLKQCSDQLGLLEGTLEGAKRTAAAAIKTRLEGIITSLEVDDSASALLQRQNEAIAPTRVVSKIEMLNLEGEVVRLSYGLGRNAKEIAELFGLKPREVSQFLKYYQRCAPAKRAKLSRASIFDSKSQLEELATTILRQLNTLEGADNELHVQYVREMRMTIEQATKLTERMLNYSVYENLVGKVREILVSELPHRQVEICTVLEKVLPTNTM